MRCSNGASVTCWCGRWTGRRTILSGLGNFVRRLALPARVKHGWLMTLREKLIKIGTKVVHHAWYVTCQLAEVAIPRGLYEAILERIRRFAAWPAMEAPS